MGTLILNNLKDLDPERDGFYSKRMNTMKNVRIITFAIMIGFITWIEVVEVLYNVRLDKGNPDS